MTLRLPRLEKVREEMANLKEESATLMARWRNEKDVIDVVREAQQKIEDLKTEAEQAKRIGDLNRASELTYGSSARRRERAGRSSGKTGHSASG